MCFCFVQAFTLYGTPSVTNKTQLELILPIESIWDSFVLMCVRMCVSFFGSFVAQSTHCQSEAAGLAANTQTHSCLEHHISFSSRASKLFPVNSMKMLRLHPSASPAAPPLLTRLSGSLRSQREIHLSDGQTWHRAPLCSVQQLQTVTLPLPLPRDKL